MSEALRLAELLTNLKSTVKGRDNAEAMEEAAAELRRLAAENKLLNAEIAEQARVNGMGGEREARLMAVNAELVEALREMLENGGDFTAKRDAARAALAKAQGETK